jgi:hypothetical protein
MRCERGAGGSGACLTFRIRPVRDEDARSIAEIHARAWRWAYRDLLLPAFLDRLSVDRRAAYWQQWLAEAAARRQLWLAVEQDRPVGRPGRHVRPIPLLPADPGDGAVSPRRPGRLSPRT